MLCPDEVRELASEILCEFKSHKPVLDAKVTVEYLFAIATEEDAPAIMVGGYPALGMCRIVGEKDRAKGCKDVEITIDREWWNGAEREEQKALLDHELHHISVVEGKRDSNGRPKIRLRKHDVQIGWFREIAARHGQHSQERQQAKSLIDDWGQYFFPEIVGPQQPDRVLAFPAVAKG
jgi:hypothetical protein